MKPPRPTGRKKGPLLFLAVNFHYIGDPKDFRQDVFHPVSQAALRSQLTELSRHFEFIGQDRLLSALRDGSPLPERCCLITFDDGLKCQYENALPILDAMAVPALFFVSTLPYADRRACTVHRIQQIRARLTSERLWGRMADLHDRMTGRPLPYDESVKARVISQYRYDDESDARVKFLLNYSLEASLRDRLVEAIFMELLPDELQFCGRLYLDQEMLADLARRSLLGIHSHGHTLLSPLSADLLREDLSKNLSILQGMIGGGHAIKAISYPYGGAEAVSIRVSETARELGLELGFTMERAFNASLEHPLLFARVDTNDAPGGKAPRFAIDGDGIKPASPDGFPPRRTLFFQER